MRHTTDYEDNCIIPETEQEVLKVKILQRINQNLSLEELELLEKNLQEKFIAEKKQYNTFIK